MTWNFLDGTNLYHTENINWHYDDGGQKIKGEGAKMGIELKKPKCKLTGTNGNIFALLGKASRALKDAGQRDKALEMTKKVFASGSYDEALNIIQQYVEAS